MNLFTPLVSPFFNAYNSYVKNNKIDINAITNDLIRTGLSESTAKRRASTVRAWVEWLVSKNRTNLDF